MATFLDLARKVARESGTVSGVQPVTTAGQVGRLLKVVEWVRDAWVEIQASRPEWLFLRATFAGETVAGQAKYTAASWGLGDFGDWFTRPGAWILHRSAAGLADATAIDRIVWQNWRRRYALTVNNPARPAEYAITPQRAVALGPTPDDAYTIEGEYIRSPHRLDGDDDIPRDLPERHHDIIAWLALIKLAQHDEAPSAIQRAQVQYRTALTELERDQLPGVRVSSEPLA